MWSTSRPQHLPSILFRHRVITPVASGNTLQLSWPANYLGWTLQSQTNAPGVGIGPDWSIVPGSTVTNQFSTTLNNTNGSAFFRLIDL